MLVEENKQLILRYFEALKGDWHAAMDKYISDSDKELKDHILMLQVPFPGYTLTAEDIIAEGDKVVVRATMHATHEAPLFEIPATHKKVTVPGIIIYQIAGDKIVKHWMVFDMLGLTQQLQAEPVLTL